MAQEKPFTGFVFEQDRILFENHNEADFNPYAEGSVPKAEPGPALARIWELAEKEK